MKLRPLRVWDLPTRIFHWLLAVLVISLLASGLMGGAAMAWHPSLGYGVLALLMFRVIWGFTGGHWSRFRHFVPSLRQVMMHVHSGLPPTAGHNPMGALSVLTMLLLLLLQVSSGLVIDDEIAFVGPLNAWVPAEWAHWATRYHRGLGKALLIGVITLHLLAVAYHQFRLKHPIVQAMIHGNQVLPKSTPESRDDVWTRTRGAIVLLLCGVGVYVLIRLSA